MPLMTTWMHLGGIMLLEQIRATHIPHNLTSRIPKEMTMPNKDHSYREHLGACQSWELSGCEMDRGGQKRVQTSSYDKQAIALKHMFLLTIDNTVYLKTTKRLDHLSILITKQVTLLGKVTSIN